MEKVACFMQNNNEYRKLSIFNNVIYTSHLWMLLLSLSVCLFEDAYQLRGNYNKHAVFRRRFILDLTDKGS